MFRAVLPEALVTSEVVDLVVHAKIEVTLPLCSRMMINKYLFRMTAVVANFMINTVDIWQ